MKQLIVKRACRSTTYPYDVAGANSTFTYIRVDVWLEEYDSKKKIFHYPRDPDRYLKPLDVVKVRDEWKDEICFAIYLGNKKVYYLTSVNQGVAIKSLNAQYELFKYYLTIPFCKWEDIITNISKIVGK